MDRSKRETPSSGATREGRAGDQYYCARLVRVRFVFTDARHWFDDPAAMPFLLYHVLSLSGVLSIVDIIFFYYYLFYSGREKSKLRPFWKRCTNICQ